MIPAVGQVWKNNYDGSEWVIYILGKPTFTTEGRVQYRNHLLNRLGQKGQLLTNNAQNMTGANVEKFSMRYTYVRDMPVGWERRWKTGSFR